MSLRVAAEMFGTRTYDRSVNKNPLKTAFRQPRVDPDPNRQPPVDWTGHAYKAVNDLRINMAHVGREVMRGGPHQTRTYTSNYNRTY